jgi:hypothetical protein
MFSPSSPIRSFELDGPRPGLGSGWGKAWWSGPDLGVVVAVALTGSPGTRSLARSCLPRASLSSLGTQASTAAPMQELASLCDHHPVMTRGGHAVAEGTRLLPLSAAAPTPTTRRLRNIEDLCEAGRRRG